jgi:methionine sulfoxide reductase heme-binding subunit
VNSYTDPGQHLFWLGSRAFGVVALLMSAFSVGLGLAMSGRMSDDPGYTKKLHEATALTALLAIAAHGLLLLGDTYLKPGLAGILVPFATPVDGFWTGLGIIAGWLAAILGLSFYARRWIGNTAWRRMHRWTLAVYVLGAAHTLGSGTDSGSIWLLAIVIATAAPILLFALARFFPPADRASGPGALSSTAASSSSTPGAAG